MRKLLSAGLVRLWRNKIFWLSCAVMAGLETFYIISAWCDGRETGLYSGLDRIYFLFSAVVGFLSALTCAFSIGPEYSATSSFRAIRAKVFILRASCSQPSPRS